jgi:hypothetical protein
MRVKPQKRQGKWPHAQKGYYKGGYRKIPGRFRLVHLHGFQRFFAAAMSVAIQTRLRINMSRYAYIVCHSPFSIVIWMGRPERSIVIKLYSPAIDMMPLMTAVIIMGIILLSPITARTIQHIPKRGRR